MSKGRYGVEGLGFNAGGLPNSVGKHQDQSYSLHKCPHAMPDTTKTLLHVQADERAQGATTETRFHDESR